MIISRTPYRVSLFGEGSDAPAWSSAHGGAVLGFAINKYSMISLRVLPPFFDYRYRVVWSKVELVQELAQIQHPVVREVLLTIPRLPGLEIHHDGDLPAGSGLGSGGSFMVGMLNVAHAFQGTMASHRQLALDAIHLGLNVLREECGRQDQILAAYGGVQHMIFDRDGSFHVEPLYFSRGRRESLQAGLMMFFVGHETTNPTEGWLEKDEVQHQLAAMTQQGVEIIQNDDRSLNELGEMLHHSWSLKRSLVQGGYPERVEEIYQSARKAGAVGGKLTGVRGGFLLLWVNAHKRDKVRQALADLVEVSVEIGSAGSKIVVYEPDDYREPC
ncbi:MAG: kinase [Magnetococcales bacterium]|nr:kinase [Magnetococcales bacterium]NGZ28578.1 kinase [Magnetococcales bacterium]